MKLLPFAFMVAVASTSVGAQDSQIRLRLTVDSLFAAMRRSDTAAVRVAFVPSARIIPFPPSSTLPVGPGLTVDAFVGFAGRNPPGAWDESIVTATGSTDSTLGTLWFTYSIRRSGTVAQCGTNSVQLVDTTAGWKIVSMVFTSRQTGC